MFFVFCIFLSAALTAGLILLLKWAVAEDRKTTLRERFNRVIEDWGKEK